MERIVITGMGTVSPLVWTVEETWKNVTAGVSGVGPITLFDHSKLGVHIACEVKNFEADKYMDAKEARRRDRFEQLATAAALEAIADARLEVTEETSPRIGIIVSSAIGGLKSIAEAVLVNENEGHRRVSPFLIPMIMSNGPSGLIAIDNRIRGPGFSVASACPSGADGIGMALPALR